MTRILGASAVMVAFGIAIVGMVMAVVGARTRRADLVRGAYAATYVNFGLLAIATLAMVYALVTHDFSVSYVAQVGSRSTPVFYTVISLWGALEGSILFWGLVLAGFSAVAVWRGTRVPAGRSPTAPDVERLMPYATAILLGIGAFFYLLLVMPANPFLPVSPVPADGPGPNPLLQNHILMGIHPPLLYLGYVGMSVPFAFAMGALLAGVSGGAWIQLTRRWTTAAWMFLTAAIIAGLWWSYEVLGCGGYWAWDPVENASFLPWLTATAFLHSAMVEERRGMLRVWNLSLITATFALTILGTFLTRSGILSSVHAFAEGDIGYWFLAFIALVLVFSLALVAGRSDQLRTEGKLDAVASRETAFLVNNLLFSVFTFTVLLGTLFPLMAEAVRGVKVSVGEPFFNSMTLPLCMALLFLMGVGPALPWRVASRDVVRRELAIPAVLAVIVAAVVAIFVGWNGYAIVTFAFGTFALAVNLRQFVIGARARMRAHGEGAPVALARLVGANRRRYGGYLAHVGAITVAVAVGASSAYKSETEATLRKGETMSLRGQTIRLDELWGRQEPQRFVLGADVSVLRDGEAAGRMDPRLNFYQTSDQPIATPAVRSRWSGDLYLNLMAVEPDGSTATIRMIVEPLVPWIWAGGFIIVLGGMITVAPSRRRERSPVAVPVGARPPLVPGAAPARPLVIADADTRGAAP
ncbi:MAG: heme lyase CcmF/NrfE family subunit [Gemmatimonadaceae bacterium]